LKVRQPLPVVELVLADRSHQAWLETHVPLIADELNVKRVEFAADADRYVTYEIKPNFKSLGPKFGPLAPKIKAALAKADAADLRRQLEADAKAVLTVDGQTVELTPDDVQVGLSAKAGWTAAQGRQVVVVLSTELTDELRAEGVARDFVHLVQTARKDERLDYQDRIRVRVQADGPVAEAIGRFEEYIRSETLAVELTIDGAGGRHTGEIEGHPVSLGIEVVHG
jgi:isoleucyl-tRNA synthetase